MTGRRGGTTTTNAIGSATWLSASDPQQWQGLSGDPCVAPQFNEVLWYESPIESFARRATPIGGSPEA
jgi:cytochrome P450